MTEQWTAEIPEVLRNFPPGRRITGGTVEAYGRTYEGAALAVQTLPGYEPPLFHWAVEFDTEEYPALPRHRGVMTFRAPGYALTGECQPSVVHERLGDGWHVALHGTGPLEAITHG